MSYSLCIIIKDKGSTIMPANKNKTRFVVEMDNVTAKQIHEVAVNEMKTTSEMATILIKEALIRRNTERHPIKSELSSKRVISYAQLNKAEALNKKKSESHGFIRGAEYYAQAGERKKNKEANQGEVDEQTISDS